MARHSSPFQYECNDGECHRRAPPVERKFAVVRLESGKHSKKTKGMVRDRDHPEEHSEAEPKRSKRTNGPSHPNQEPDAKAERYTGNAIPAAANPKNCQEKRPKRATQSQHARA